MSNDYRLYISGPMTGLPNFNYDLFHEAEEYIKNPPWNIKRNRLAVPVNPARNFEGRQDLDRQVYLDAAVEQVKGCDGLFLLPGWEDSEGARLEVNVGLAQCLDFYEWDRENDQVHTLSAEEVSERLEGWAVAHSTPLEQQETHGRLVQQAQPFLPSSIEVYQKQPETIEHEASRLVRNGKRQQTYGHPRGDFDRVAAFWSAHLGVPVTAEDVAIMMIAFKLARLSTSPKHRDSKVDVIGYTICLDRLDEAS